MQNALSVISRHWPSVVQATVQRPPGGPPPSIASLCKQVRRSSPQSASASHGAPSPVVFVLLVPPLPPPPLPALPALPALPLEPPRILPPLPPLPPVPLPPLPLSSTGISNR